MINMQELFGKMFQGWILHEKSWNGESYDRNESECYIEACGGDENEGYMIELFSHWQNDIQSLSAHWGVILDRHPPTDEFPNGELFINYDVPPAPTPKHWWQNGGWVEPEADQSDVEGPVKSEQ